MDNSKITFINESPVCVVMIGYLDENLNWNTNFSIPFFNLEKAKEYETEFKKYLDEKYQTIIVPVV